MVNVDKVQTSNSLRVAYRLNSWTLTYLLA